MTATRSAGAQFGLVELDLLATFAGGRPPFPLRLPSFGRVPDERDLLLAGAGETLRLRGLAGVDGPLGLAARLAALLADRSGGIDLVLGGPGWDSGAVALVDRAGAVLCLQRFNLAEHHLVDTEQVDGDRLADELYALVPELAGGRAIPLRLPLGALRAAHGLLSTPDQGPATAGRVHQVLRAGGVDVATAEKLASVLHPLTGYGQLGATRPVPGGDDVRVGHELSWIDTPTGRYRVDASHDGWVSVNPLPPEELFTLVRGFVSRTRRGAG